MENTNNFIIGLGGVGGRAVAAFRSICTGKEADCPATSPAFTYLYIDSSTDVMSDRRLWNDPMSQEDFIHLDPKGVDYHSPMVTPWLPDKHVLPAEITEPSIPLCGTEQNRLFGRVLFASYAEVIQKALDIRINSMVQASGHNTADFHIFASAGGGTGSGGIVDMITAIDRLCKEKMLEKQVFVYLFVGGPSSAWSDIGLFALNEYCTLRDLNGLMAETYHPHMAIYSNFSGASERYHQGSTLPVKRVFVCSDVAPSPLRNMDTQTRYMADACFSFIHASYVGQPADALRPYYGEDLILHHSYDEGYRSYRFSTMGIHHFPQDASDRPVYPASMDVFPASAATQPEPVSIPHKLISPRGTALLFPPEYVFDRNREEEKAFRTHLESIPTHQLFLASDPQLAPSIITCQYWMPAYRLDVLRDYIHPKYQQAMQSPQAAQISRWCNLDEDGATCDEYAPGTTRPALLPK